MNAKTIFFGIIVFGLASTALSINDARLAANQYRWILVDGPFACPSKEDVRQITQHHTDETELQMVGELRAYYLISGTIAKLVQEDPSSGMSQIRLGGVTRDLWTYTKFLSKRPLTGPYGSIETPETSGFSAEANGYQRHARTVGCKASTDGESGTAYHGGKAVIKGKRSNAARLPATAGRHSSGSPAMAPYC